MLCGAQEDRHPLSRSRGITVCRFKMEPMTTTAESKDFCVRDYSGVANSKHTTVLPTDSHAVACTEHAAIDRRG